MAFTLPELPYAYEALEPVIDSETMHLHHDKHHAGYTSKLNDAIAGTEWENRPIEEILGNLSSLPRDVQTKVRNNGGGYYNHALFWPLMQTPQTGGSNAPAGDLLAAIEQDLGGFDKFKTEFSEAAANRFGSGWAWLIVKGSDGKLAVTSTPNQDSPLMKGHHDLIGTPVLGLDVWEHAYYKKYGPGRADYIKAWWNTVNWQQAARNYAKAKA